MSFNKIILECKLRHLSANLHDYPLIINIVAYIDI